MTTAGRSLTPQRPQDRLCEQIRLLLFEKSWREKEQAIEAYNSRNDSDGGAHLQNSVYSYTKMVLREQGLDKAGWEAYPVAMGSPLDSIGADIVLVNSKTGALILMDPTSRRLDPRTGERLPDSKSGKTNVPAIREPGVVDAPAPLVLKKAAALLIRSKMTRP